MMYVTFGTIILIEMLLYLVWSVALINKIGFFLGFPIFMTIFLSFEKYREKGIDKAREIYAKMQV